MKKILISLLVVGCLLGAPVVHAENNSPEQVQLLRTQLVSLLTQMIALLQQQLAVMVAQENLVKQNQEPISNSMPVLPNSNIQLPISVSPTPIAPINPTSGQVALPNTPDGKEASCTLAAVDNQYTNHNYGVLISWTTQGMSDGTVGKLYAANRWVGETPEFDYPGSPILKAPSGIYDGIGRSNDYRAVFGGVECTAKLTRPSE